MLVEVESLKRVGKEKSFLTKEGSTVSSQIVELTWNVGQGSQSVMALCGTVVCDKLRAEGCDTCMVKKADIRFCISPSRSNPNYRFTTCYVEDVFF